MNWFFDEDDEDDGETKDSVRLTRQGEILSAAL
jgi:hypothetical protein